MRMHPLRTIHITLFLLIFLTGVVYSQTTQENWGYYPESLARQIAVTTAIPTYPAEAVQQHITGVVQARILINERGEVEQIKINPSINPFLKQATADAVCQWTFKLDPNLLVANRNHLSRLTFKFSISESGPVVELYNPGPDAKGLDHLGQTDAMKEHRDWLRWPEVKPKHTE
jgi:hypothetical protein